MDKNMLSMKELYGILGERILVTLNEELSPEERSIANAQTELICKTAKQMINGADIILRAEKLASQNKTLTKSTIMGIIDNEVA